MALDVKFSYVCPRAFAELRGQGHLSRFCDVCQLEVHNLDVLDEHQRLAFFERSVASGERVCVSATVPLDNPTPCPVPAGKSPLRPKPHVASVASQRPAVVMGRLLPADPKQLQAERERLEGQKKPSKR
jgi:hypothetical protein